MKELKLKSDEDLMKEYQQGNLMAFQEIYSRYAGKIYGYLRKKLRNQSMADDIFQTTFMKFHHSRSTYDSKYLLKPWIFTICRNSINDYFRKIQSEKNISNIEIDVLSSQEEEIKEKSEALKEIGELPENQRLAVEYRYYQDYSFEEIAERLNTSPNNARQLISRGIRKLKSLMIPSTKKTTI